MVVALGGIRPYKSKEALPAYGKYGPGGLLMELEMGRQPWLKGVSSAVVYTHDFCQ